MRYPPVGILWLSNARHLSISGDITPDREPLLTSFLALDTDRIGTTHFACCEHGRIVQTGALVSAGKVRQLVGKLYRESVSTGVPLVVVMEKPRRGAPGYHDANGFPFQQQAVREAVVQAIDDVKSKDANKRVTVTRLLVLSKRDVSQELFGDRDMQPDRLLAAQESAATEVLGHPVGDSLQARCICVVHNLSRSMMGAKATPISFTGQGYF